jgi:hypothetical protein
MPNPPGPLPRGIFRECGSDRRTTSPIGAADDAGRRAIQAEAYGDASRTADLGASNDPFITCDPLGFPRNLLAHAVSSRGRMIFGSAPDRILIAYEQQRVWREIWMDGRAQAVDVKGARVPILRVFSGRWDSDNTLVIDTTGVDERLAG